MSDVPQIPYRFVKKRLGHEGASLGIGDAVTATREGDRIVMRGSPTGTHSVGYSDSSDERVGAHVKGYVEFTYKNRT